jgi:alpha-L-rhamnosidase
MSRGAAVLLLSLLSASPFFAQTIAPNIPPPGQLDPTRSIQNPQLFSSFHQPLPEQYIWTADSPASTGHGSLKPGDEEPRYFRAHFKLASIPGAATLYLAGTHTAEVWVNGTEAGQFAADPLSRLKIHVFHADVTHLLHSGDNIVAIRASRGRALVAKIIPAAPGFFAPAILVSDHSWKSATAATDGWYRPDYTDTDWKPVSASGSIEGNIEFFQWNNDAGLYDWPGYEGASPFLAHIFLPAAAILQPYAPHGPYENTDTLTTAGEQASSTDFTVHLAASVHPAAAPPAITLDFGREVAGRVQLISDSDQPASVSITYGESTGEVDNGPWLGVNSLVIPPHGTVAGPKSAFRFVRIRFLSGPPTLRFKSIRVEDIYYPVHYEGSFESSDPLLNRIWETGVYTTHLCMQDDIWDAPKRDRGRWMGDTDVSGRVIDDVFADHFLLEDTMTRLIGPLPLKEHVNRIPGYSSFWVTELAHYLRHSGRKEYVASMHDRLVALLQFMDADFDAQNHFINHTHEWPFVDWALDLNGDTPETRVATAFEYARADRDGAWLLRQIGDTQNAQHYEDRANAIAQSAEASDWANGSYGPRWQTNAMAVISGVARPGEYGSIWQNVLANVGKPTFRPDIITPYYGAYVLDAMAEMNHREDALKWIREFWGGMIEEKATSFWESYDPSWPRKDPHVNLAADNSTGYQTSLAHGWSSAPSFWLMEQVLGIRPTAPGFAQTTIRPDLVDLSYARGAEPTPQGLLKVDLRKAGNGPNASLNAAVDIPAGVQATVLFPVSSGMDHILVNGASRAGTPAENGARLAVTLDHPGHYELTAP